MQCRLGLSFTFVGCVDKNEEEGEIHKRKEPEKVKKSVIYPSIFFFFFFCCWFKTLPVIMKGKQ